MRKILLVLLLFFIFCIQTFSQVRFSKYYDNQTSNRINDLSKDLIQLNDSGYLIPIKSVAIYQVDTLGFAVTYLQVIRTNKYGDTLYQKSYQRKNFSISPWSITKINNGYLISGHIFDLVKYYNDTIGSKILLVKINEMGDTLWSKTLDIGDGDEFTQKLINTSDGGFAIMGQVCDKLETNCDVYLMKLDSNANMIWYKTYTWAENFWEGPTSFIQLPSKEYIITSYTEDIKSRVRYPYIIKTDSAGNLLWQKKLDIEGQEFGLVKDVCLASNNTYLFSGVIGRDDIPYEISKGWILRTDTSGNYIQNIKVGDENKYTSFEKIQEVRGNICIQGYTNNYNTVSLKPRVCLYAFNSSIEKLWRRAYQDSLLINQNYIIYNMISTMDRGFAMIGFGRNPKDSIQSQDVWLMKVDSMGCLYEQCIALGVDENISTSINELKIFPNPANQYLQIELEDKEYDIEIVDMLGKIVYRSVIQKEAKLELANFAEGVYILKAKDNSGNYYSKKFIVRH